MWECTHHHANGKERKISHPFQLSILHSSSKTVFNMEVSKLYLSGRTLWGHISMPLTCSHHIWPSLESFTRENSSSELECDTLFSGTILPMAGQAPECMLLGSLNWVFLTLGKTKKSIMPKKATQVSLLVYAALEKEMSSWVQSMQMRHSYASSTSSSRI